MLSWGVSMVVRFYWLAACDCHQCCVGIFHDALRVEIREGALRQLAGLHGCLLFSEPSRHSAIKGKTETAAFAINPQTFYFFTARLMKTLLLQLHRQHICLHT